jgi:subtilisin-like proprotein convertase family protein
MAMKTTSTAIVESHFASCGPWGRARGFVLLLWLAMAPARADVIVSQTFSPDVAIPEGNPVGVVSAGDFTTSPAGEPVLAITVDLNTTGGYNGDLYAYLVAPDGTRVTLMDQPGTAVDGFGAESSGMNLTLDDNAGTSIQSVTGGAGTVLMGTFQPDETMGTFDNSAADGTWDLYFADLGSDAGSPVLNSWTLNIDVVPEPVNQALGIFLVAWAATVVAPMINRFRARKSRRPSVR